MYRSSVWVGLSSFYTIKRYCELAVNEKKRPYRYWLQDSRETNPNVYYLVFHKLEIMLINWS